MTPFAAAQWSGGEVEAVHTLPAEFDILERSLPAQVLGGDGQLRDGVFLRVRGSTNGTHALWFSDGTVEGSGRVGDVALSAHESAVWTAPDSGIYLHGSSPTRGLAVFRAQSPELAIQPLIVAPHVPALSLPLIGVGRFAVQFFPTAIGSGAKVFAVDGSIRNAPEWPGLGRPTEATSNDSSMYFFNRPPSGNLQLLKLDLASASVMPVAPVAPALAWMFDHQIAAARNFVCVKDSLDGPIFRYVAFCTNPADGIAYRLRTPGGDAIRQLDFGSKFLRIGEHMLLDGIEIRGGAEVGGLRRWTTDGTSNGLQPLYPADASTWDDCMRVRDGSVLQSVRRVQGLIYRTEIWLSNGTPAGSRPLADIGSTTERCRGLGAWLAFKQKALVVIDSRLLVADAATAAVSPLAGFPHPSGNVVAIERVGTSILIVSQVVGVGVTIWRYVPDQIFGDGFR